ncbi:MAG: hypothetical protein EU529_14880 [Promethearchaeota archaeon]|nr:MAG: hypothetical protein EU529_14880 [Candidatus Lokiarchaeota archaeon]
MENLYAKQRIIRDVKNEDERIQITGYVKNLVENDHIILEDKTGHIKVRIKNIDFNFTEKNLVNIIGNLLIKTDGEKIIDADIVQDMNNLNFEYYCKLYELKKELNEKEK